MSEFISCRIAKFIAMAGVCSRRQAEKMIADGRVKLDGKIASTPAINVGLQNIIEIDNKIVTKTYLHRMNFFLFTSSNCNILNSYKYEERRKKN